MGNKKNTEDVFIIIINYLKEQKEIEENLI